MANIYQPTIKESIKGMLTTLAGMVDVNGNILWQYTAIWNDHYKRLMNGSGYSFNLPACFIEIKDISSEVLGGGISTQDVNIIFHILHREEDATDGTLDQNLDVFDYRTYTRQMFTNYNTPGMNTLMFTKEIEDFKHGNVYHFQEIFKTKYTDYSASPYFNGAYIVLQPNTWNLDTTEEFVPSIDDL